MISRTKNIFFVLLLTGVVGVLSFSKSFGAENISLVSEPGNDSLVIDSPQVTSLTHPDQTQWYNNNSPVFQWLLDSSVTQVRLGLSQDPGSKPKVSYQPPIIEKKIEAVDDGVWYLHSQFVRGKTSSEINTFQFNIDTKSPTGLVVERQNQDDLTNPQPSFLISAKDNISGIDHYEIQISDQSIGSDTKGHFSLTEKDVAVPFVLPRQKPGLYNMQVSVFDKAGNVTVLQTTVRVESIAAPIFDAPPVTLKSDMPLVLNGTASSNDSVVLVVVKEGTALQGLIGSFAQEDTIATETTIANPAGHWLASIKDLPGGRYQVYAYTQDDRGALSEYSSPSSFTIERSFFWKDMGGVVKRAFTALWRENGGWFLASVILYVVLFSIIGDYVWPRITTLLAMITSPKKKLRTSNNKAVASHDQLMQEVSLLEADIAKDLALLSKTKTRRTLYPEEKYLQTRLVKYRKIIKKVIVSVK